MSRRNSKFKEAHKKKLMKRARLSEAEAIRQSLFRKAPGLESVEVLRKMRESRH